MKKLFYLFTIVALLAFGGCTSNSNSGAGKFLGEWQHFNTVINDTVVLDISEGEGNTFDILWQGKSGLNYPHATEKSYKGFKYDQGKDVLYKGSMKIVYNDDSSSVRIFVNNLPDEISYKKVE